MKNLLARIRRRLTSFRNRDKGPQANLIRAYKLHREGVDKLAASRALLTDLYPELKGETWTVRWKKLQDDIENEIQDQIQFYPHFKYENGFPYQSLATLGIFRIRHTETRFEEYGLANLITRNDRILDIGCNCGFMAIYSAFRTGCRAEGIDINPHMIKIGNHVSRFLKLDDRVNLHAGQFQAFTPAHDYTMIFSFAVHWTDDLMHRPVFHDYMSRLHRMLTKDGVVIFETHCNDVGDPEFYKRLELLRSLFSWPPCRRVASGQRELYIMRKI